MNNSIARLVDGMAATLRTEVIPHIDNEYARGQAFGVIYMLNSLKLRASWSNVFLTGQLRALEETSRELADLAPDLSGAPLPNIRAPRDLPDVSDLEAIRDEGDAKLCALIDWLKENGDVAPEAIARARAIIDEYLNRQTKYELASSARPMFVEMSGGSETEHA